MIVLLVFCGSLAAQELYKWTDENGNIHYEDKPPAGPANESNLTKVADTAVRNSITKTPVAIDTSHANGITRYILYANEILSTHSDWPTTHTITA